MAFYTKYRPKDFDNLVGQEFVKETLKKAIEEDKTVGAYLFCGPRGTGKTSTARLFAKTINCLDLKNGNPCLKCENCKDFADEKLIDIIEIDAASHTGVDNIREIIEKAQFSPTKTKYKVYIIDEVHMLSKGAFNALLKILEEPPTHVKFILATTETHKVPETIISRCQRFDFKRIDNENIKKRLEFIAEKENIKIDEKSLNYIISSSNGGLRNAISLFEQLVENSEIKYENIIEKLGISSEDELEKFITKLQNYDISIINDFDNFVDSGKNLKLFFKALIFKTKDKIIENLKSGNDISSLISIFDSLDETYLKVKNSLDENTTFLVGILKIVGKVEKEQYKKEEVKKKESLKIKKEVDIPKETPKKTVNEIIAEPEVSVNDLDDIFGDFSNNEEKNEDSLHFSVGDFIAKLKEQGAKGALTMSLRGSKISLREGILEISPNTKIMRNTVESSDNQGVMMQTLNKMGYENIKITIK